MKDTEIKRLLSAHFVSVMSIILTTIVPPFFLENFSVLGTHLIWLCICSICVTTVNIILYIILKPNPSSKRISFAHKVTKFLKCCVVFFISCILFHGIIVLYGAPLIESVLETFLFAVLLSTFTTLHCLCMLGPNIQAWIRVFSKNGSGPFPVPSELPLATWLASLLHLCGYTGIGSSLHTKADNGCREKRMTSDLRMLKILTPPMRGREGTEDVVSPPRPLSLPSEA
ncbi:phosphatidylinositol-glycan biosynthesis class F protein isoform 2-T3 [Pangshura tecta]